MKTKRKVLYLWVLFAYILAALAACGGINENILGKSTLSRPLGMALVTSVIQRQNGTEFNKTTLESPGGKIIKDCDYLRAGYSDADICNEESQALSGSNRILRFSFGLTEPYAVKIVAEWFDESHVDVAIRIEETPVAEHDHFTAFLRLSCTGDANTGVINECEEEEARIAQGATLLNRVIGLPNGGFEVAGKETHLVERSGVAINNPEWFTSTEGLIHFIEWLHPELLNLDAAAEQSRNKLQRASEQLLGGWLYYVTQDATVMNDSLGDAVLLRMSMGDIFVRDTPNDPWKHFRIVFRYDAKWNNLDNLKNFAGIVIDDIFTSGGKWQSNVDYTKMKFIETSGWINTPHPEFTQADVYTCNDKVRKCDYAMSVGVFAFAGSGYSVVFAFNDAAIVDDVITSNTFNVYVPQYYQNGEDIKEYTDTELRVLRAKALADMKTQIILSNRQDLFWSAFLGLSDSSSYVRECKNDVCTVKVVSRKYATEFWYYPDDLQKIVAFLSILGYNGGKMLGVGFTYKPFSGNHFAPSALFAKCGVLGSYDKNACMSYALAGMPVFTSDGIFNYVVPSP